MSLITDKIKLIDSADEKIRESADKIQESIFSKIWKFILNNRDKNFTQNNLTKINKFLNDTITKSIFRSPLKNYLKNFDDLEGISKKIFEKELGDDLSGFNLNVEKQLAIDDIIDGLLNDDMLNANLRSPLRKMLYRYSTVGTNIEDIEKELRDFILTDTTKLGFIEKYVRTLSIESLSRFDGSINQRMVKEYGLDGFRIVGSLIKTSEPQCIHMVNETGDLGVFAVNGKYAIEDLPEIISILKNRYKGVYEFLTPDNYFYYRNHWGCRHQFIPTRLLAKDRAILDERR